MAPADGRPSRLLGADPPLAMQVSEHTLRILERLRQAALERAERTLEQARDRHGAARRAIEQVEASLRSHHDKTPLHPARCVDPAEARLVSRHARWHRHVLHDLRAAHGRARTDLEERITELEQAGKLCARARARLELVQRARTRHAAARRARAERRGENELQDLRAHLRKPG